MKNVFFLMILLKAKKPATQCRVEIIIKSLDPLKAKKTFIRKKLGHTMVSAIKASSVTLYIVNLAKGARGKYCELEVLIMTVISKTDIHVC